MSVSLQLPNGLTIAEFLADYWQQKPLYMPSALSFDDPISPDELAGLACEDEVVSRMVIQHTDKPGVAPWEVRHGPFSEDDFSKLPTSHWSLLVQDVNRHLRELDQLLGAFNFLPDWRIDDVMVSYAEAFGSVGAHVDQYDVFLLQGMGSRRWQISQSDNRTLLADTALRILKEFVAEEEFILKPGDILYLPAGVQHYGVSETPCITYSIGFRAPEQLELLGDYVDHCILKQEDPNQSHDSKRRYTDPPLALQACGELTAEALYNIRQLIQHIPTDAANIEHWFGMYITRTLQDDESIPMTCDVLEEFSAELKHHSRIYRDNESRFAYIKQAEGIELFVNGASAHLSGACGELACYLCNHREYKISELQHWLGDRQCMNMLGAWWQQQLLDFNEDEL